jgi:hypothetical protein
MKSTGLSIVAVLGLVTAGFGGYNLVTTGCPLGTCDAPTTLTTVAGTTDAKDHACALGCSEHAPAPIDVVSVANETDPAKSACCAGDEAAKAAKLAKGESCCGGCSSKTEAGKGTCPMTGSCEKDAEASKTDGTTEADPKQPA